MDYQPKKRQMGDQLMKDMKEEDIPVASSELGTPANKPEVLSRNGTDISNTERGKVEIGSRDSQASQTRNYRSDRAESSLENCTIPEPPSASSRERNVFIFPHFRPSHRNRTPSTVSGTGTKS
jgi:hypothetical protein